MSPAEGAGRGAGQLSREDWETIQAAFADALERPVAERAAFLDTTCPSRPELRAEVESLLAAHDRAETFLAEPGVTTVAPGLAGPSLLGRRVGAWRTVELLGRGGMGTVYLAERADGQFEQQAALKVVKRGMDTDAILGRFVRERQILARLNHPNIARLLDGGVTDDGRPYFVMEHVEGVPLTRYCDERALDDGGRIRLFLEVCRAVAYAHRKLVVHRDIKPPNVLVTVSGEVKLLDFGIGTLVEGDGRAGRTTLGDGGIRPATPEYAAPEYLQGEPVTTAADVYSLGAVLEELLTGERPVRPSSPGRRGGPGRPHGDGGLARRLDGETAARRLGRDLDTIVSTARHPELDRRYPTVEALQQDLQRFLEGRPIEARGDSAVYRSGKFVRRHRLAVGAATLVLLALTGSAVAVGLQSAEAARERDRAELRAAEAQEVADFLVSLFQGADPQREPGTHTARELLDRGAERLEGEPLAHPLTRARLLETVAGVYHELRLLEPAARLFERAIELREREQGPEHPDLLTPLLGLAAAQMWAIRYTDAESTLARAVAIGERQPDPVSPELLRGLMLQGSLHLMRGSPAPAESVYRRALAIQERRDAASQGTANLLNNLGVAVGNQGRLGEAERLHRRALEMRRAVLGPDHPAVAQSLVNLGKLALDRGEDASAAEILDRALAIRERAFGPDHPVLAEVLALRAQARLRQGRPEAAEGDLRQALRLREARLGPRHPETALTRLELARTLAARGVAHEEAVSLAEAAVAGFREAADAPRADLLDAEALLAELRDRNPP